MSSPLKGAESRVAGEPERETSTQLLRASNATLRNLDFFHEPRQYHQSSLIKKGSDNFLAVDMDFSFPNKETALPPSSPTPAFLVVPAMS